MRRTFCAFVVAILLAGCGATGSSLPYRGSALDDPMGMTVEQYALRRLPAAGRDTIRCAAPHQKLDAASRKALAKACRHGR
jgi:hypothetical protein